MFGRFYVCAMTDEDADLRVTRLGDGDDEVSCHFFAGWNYPVERQDGSGGYFFRWAFRGCTAYGARAVRICRKAYRKRRFEVDMELMPADYISKRTNERIQWHRVLAIDGPFTRVSNVKEWYSEEEIASYREALKAKGLYAPTVLDPGTAADRPGAAAAADSPAGSSEGHQEGFGA